MDNFTFFNPTKIEFGRGVIEGLGKIVRLYGEKILLVYGEGSIKRNSVYMQVVDSLTQHHIEIFEHGGVCSNPLLSHAREGVSQAKKYEIDAVVAVGGGSVIDEAKAIAAGSVANCDIWDFYTKKEHPTKALPLISVLTLPATGSEMNGFTVLTNEETKEKFALGASPVLNPRVSFLDPETTYSLPLTQTAFACADILSHLTEGYFTTSAKRLILQDSLIKSLFLSAVEAMGKIQENPTDYDARAAFMWTATLAWNSIAQVGIPQRALPCHALEMPLSGIYNVAHGAGLSIITPHWLRLAAAPHKERIRQFGREVLGGIGTVESTIDGLIEIYEKIGAPLSMREVGLTSPDLDKLTESAHITFAARNMDGYSKEVIRSIYEAAL